MVLQAVSPVKCDEYTDKQSGEIRTFHYCELTLTDSLDTIIAELAVPGVRDAAGQTSYPQPEFTPYTQHAVSLEFSGRTWEKDGRSGYSNRCRIRKIAKL